MIEKTSYAQIIRSTSIMGGVAIISLLLSMIRIKFAAVLLGTTGIGLLTSLTALQGIIGTVAGLGVQSSAVREVAVATGKSDCQAVGRTVLTLRRICWLTGTLGLVATILLSPFLSQVTFDNQDYVFEIALIGLAILFGIISGGQVALIQGTRRIGDLALINIYGAAMGTAVSIGMYLVFGLHGVVPALIAVGASQLAFSWYFARQVPVTEVILSFGETFREAKGMFRLGSAFMWYGIMYNAVGFITITLITQHANLQAVGLFGAASALSGIFINFVLNSMGSDFYPRLSGAASDNVAMCRMINEQTEIALLLSLPGLIMMLALGPYIIQVFYAEEFITAVGLLQWFVLGSLWRLLSWPLHFVSLALGKSWWYLLVETSISITHIGLIVLGLYLFDLEGVSIAFYTVNIIYVIGLLFTARYLIRFKWSIDVIKYTLVSVLLLSLAFLVCRVLQAWQASIVGLLLSLFASIICLRGISTCLGAHHKVITIICKIPGAKFVLKSK